MLADFRHREIEFLAQPILQALKNLSFSFQGMTFRNEQFNGTDTNDHARWLCGVEERPAVSSLAAILSMT